MMKKVRITLTIPQVQTIIRALDEMKISILTDNDGSVPEFDKATFYMGQRLENKLREGTNEN